MVPSSPAFLLFLAALLHVPRKEERWALWDGLGWDRTTTAFPCTEEELMGRDAWGHRGGRQTAGAVHTWGCRAAGPEMCEGRWLLFNPRASPIPVGMVRAHSTLLGLAFFHSGGFYLIS